MHAPSDAQREAMDALVARARAEEGVIDASSIPYAAHELLTHLVLHHGLLLHGTNNTELNVIEPRPAHDFGTHVEAVVAADDGIWPLFYAVVARDRLEGVFTACMHLGRPPRQRRFYMFRVFGADPRDETSLDARCRLRRVQGGVSARVGERMAGRQRGNARAARARPAERLSASAHRWDDPSRRRSTLGDLTSSGGAFRVSGARRRRRVRARRFAYDLLRHDNVRVPAWR